MVDWTDIPDSALEPDAPARSIDAIAFRDNPIAIAQRVAGAPRVQVPTWEVLTGSGTYTVPDGVTRIRVYATGGGGGAAKVSTFQARTMTTGSGGGGATAIRVFEVGPGQTFSYGVGSGGSGTDSTDEQGNGSDGGGTFFGPMSASGGKGGNHVPSAGGSGGAQDGTSQAQVTIVGGAGESRSMDGVEQTGGRGNFGGGTYWGPGGPPGVRTGMGVGAGGTPLTWGGGAGANVWCQSSSSIAGVSGANGVIVVEY